MSFIKFPLSSTVVGITFPLGSVSKKSLHEENKAIVPIKKKKFFIRFILYRSLRKLILKIKFHTTGKGYRIGQ